ncbi:restriction endonuclease subunit S [Phocaeicola dorei]|jgi:type I restriction enzyme S subunit|uniref:Type I restriction endonuclease EcoAI n=2 Tax=Phocaeicola TaxID=909656 RepID=A0AA37KJB3_9BACT|nr:restriction endonuclease subunit S [Phocaeicola dorei]RJX09067.1 type I restriction endonuclease [Bacteroides sp. AF17-1]GKH83688.1 type I restriction endonuclease EcoAI [Phocaeicola dorei]
MDTKALRQKILDLAIHGKLVPQDPNDEPASVLLERIKAEKERLIKEGKIKRSKKSAKTSDTPHYENVPFEVPESWVWCRLDDIVCELKYGTSEKSSSVGKIAVLRMGNITNVGTIDYSNLVYSSNDEDIEQYSLEKNDLLFNRTNSSEWVGKTAIYKEEQPAIYAGYLIRIKPLLISPDYLNTVMNSGYYRDWCYDVKTDAVNQSNINAQKLSQLMIPIPPLKEQGRIVAEMDKWISLIDIVKNGKGDLLTVIKQAKSKILDLAIHGKLVPQDPNDEPPIELLKRINPDFTPCDNGHYTQLPDGWCVVTLKDLCENINGLWKGKKEPFVNVGVIRNANFTKDFKLDYSNIEYIDVEQRTFAKRHLENGDLIVEKSGGSDNNPVGRTILYEGKSGVFSFSNFTMALRTRNNNIVLSKFLYYYILAKYQKGDMRLMQTQTTGLRNLILDKFLSMPIHLPPLSEQKRIIDRIETIFTSLDMIMGSL